MEDKFKLKTSEDYINDDIESLAEKFGSFKVNEEDHKRLHKFITQVYKLGYERGRLSSK